MKSALMFQVETLTCRFLILLHVKVTVEAEIARQRDIASRVRRGERRFDHEAPLTSAELRPLQRLHRTKRALADRPLAGAEPDLHKLMLFIRQHHTRLTASRKNEIAVSARNGGRRPRLFQPRIDLIHSVKNKSDIPEWDFQSLLMRPRYNGLRRFDR